MDMGAATEVPDKGWAFQPPVVVNLVVTKVSLLVEGEVAAIESALGLEAPADLIAV